MLPLHNYSIELMNIIFACDSNYAKRIPTVIRSIIKYSESAEKINFYIFCAEIEGKLKQQILSIPVNILFVDVDPNYFDGCPLPNECPHLTLPTYYRFIVADKLPHVDKALYFDCDLIISNSIIELWRMDLDGALAGAVGEHDMSYQKEQLKRLGMNTDGYYFNAGVMLINLKEWRIQKISRKLFDSISLLGGRIQSADQDVLNYVLSGKVVKLSRNYNFHIKRGEYVSSEVIAGISIIHYLGTDKPWNTRSSHPLKKKYLQALSTKDRIKYAVEVISKIFFELRCTNNHVRIRVFKIQLLKYSLKKISKG